MIDASVALPWYFDDESSTKTDALYHRVLSGLTHVPDFWLLEVSNALVVATRKGRIARARLDEFLEELRAMPLIFHPASQADEIDNVVDIALDCNLTTCDAAYVALAKRVTAPLATYDIDMRSAALRNGVALMPA